MRIIEVRLYSHPKWTNFSDFVQKWEGAIAAATIKVAFNYKGIHTLTIFRSINYRRRKKTDGAQITIWLSLEYFQNKSKLSFELILLWHSVWLVMNLLLIFVGDAINKSE